MANLRKLIEKRLISKAVDKVKKLNAATPVVDDPTLQTWIKEVSSTVRDITNTGVRRSDLVRAGIATISNGELQSIFAPQEEVNLTIPVAVMNLTANGAYSSITLDWETKPSKYFGENRVYRSDVDDFGTAVQIGSSIGNVYTDYIGNNAKAYYWVRTISKYGVEGDLAPSVYAETSLDIGYLIEQLTGKINASQFTQELQTEIGRIELNSNAISQEIQNRVNAIAAESAERIAAITAETVARQQQIADNTTQLSNKIIEEQQARISDIAEEAAVRQQQILSEAEARQQQINDNATELSNKIIAEQQARVSAIAAEAEIRQQQLLAEAAARQQQISESVTELSNRIIEEQQARVSAITEEAATRQQQILEEAQARAGAIEIAVYNEQVIRQSEDEKLSQQINIVNSAVTNNDTTLRALITDEQTARVNGDEALADDIRTLSSTVTNNDTQVRALITEEATTRATENSAISTKLDGVFAQVNPSMAGSDELAGSGSMLAGVWSEQTARIEGDEALAKRIDSVVVKLSDDLSASIITERTARVSADEAMAEQIRTLNSKTGDLQGLIIEEQEVRTSQIDAISKELTFISAGVGEQFDTNIIWFFDGDTEGWTCEYGLPIISNGYIRAADYADENYLISPPLENISGSSYPHFRARIKKVGNPVWDGVLLYGLDFGESYIIPEPAWDLNDISVVQADVSWVGDIDRIKIKFLSSQDADNYYFIDWLAIGRPSPSASYSALSEEQLARAEADRANASTISTLTAVVNTNDTVYRGLISDIASISADADSVLANRATLLEAKTAENAAAITTEQTLRIEQDNALAEQINTLSAVAADNKALITSEATTRATKDDALAEQITALNSTVNNNDTTLRALITGEQTARVSGDEALAGDIRTLSSTVTNNDTQVRALITEEATTRATENSAISTKLDGVFAQVNPSMAGSDELAGSGSMLAGVWSEQTARIENDVVISQRIDTVLSDFKENDTAVRALISLESTTRASANEALAEQVELLQSKINDDISAAILNESMTRATQDEALTAQLGLLQSKVDEDISAAIRNEATARANLEEAIAENIETVQTTLDGHTASIQEHKSSIDGLQAEWKIKVQAGGKISGVSLGGSGTESEFLVLADRFAVGMSTNGVLTYPFIIDQGKVVMNTAYIKDGSIENGKIGNLSADKITTGSIAADRMKANIVSAMSGQFTELSSITAKIGLLRTATSGARTEIKDNLIEVYDTNGRIRVRLGVW